MQTLHIPTLLDRINILIDNGYQNLSALRAKLQYELYVLELAGLPLYLDEFVAADLSILLNGLERNWKKFSSLVQEQNKQEKPILPW